MQGMVHARLRFDHNHQFAELASSPAPRPTPAADATLQSAHIALHLSYFR